MPAAGAQGGLYSAQANLVIKTLHSTLRQLWLEQPQRVLHHQQQQADPLFPQPSGLNWHISSPVQPFGLSNLSLHPVGG